MVTLADLYKNKKTNPSRVVPTSSTAGRTVTNNAYVGEANQYRVPYTTVNDFYNGGGLPGAAGSPPAGIYAGDPSGGSSGGSGGGYSYGGYGGGGGGGGVSATDKENSLRMSKALMDLINSQWTAPISLKPMRRNVRRMARQDRRAVKRATRQDQRQANRSFNQLDNYLNANDQNAFADMAQVAPVQTQGGVSDAFLAAQGAQGAGDPELALVNAQGQQLAQALNGMRSTLAANETSGQRSRLAESRMGRVDTRNELGAADNAMRAFINQRRNEQMMGIDEQRLAQQQQSNQQRLALAQQLISILGPAGLDMPTLQQLGLAPTSTPRRGSGKGGAKKGGAKRSSTRGTGLNPIGGFPEDSKGSKTPSVRKQIRNQPASKRLRRTTGGLH